MEAYVFVEAKGPISLSKLVSEYMEKGYEPYGNPLVIECRGIGWVYAQAVIYKQEK